MRVSSIALVRPTKSARLATRLLAVLAVAVIALLGGALPARAASVAPASPSLAAAAGTGSISGTVTRADTGAPEAGVKVVVSQPESSGAEPDRETVTGLDGTYSVGGLTEGAPYAVYFRPDPSTFLIPEAWNGEHAMEAWAAVYVGSAPVTGIDADLETGTRFTGTVTTADGGPLPDVCLSLYANTNDGCFASSYSCAVASGVYSLVTVPGADYYLSVSTRSGPYLDAAYPGTFPTAGAGVDAALDPIVLERGAQVTGIVVDTAGSPMPGVCARLTGGDYWGGYEACSDATGRYTTSAMPAGTWTLEFAN